MSKQKAVPAEMPPSTPVEEYRGSRPIRLRAPERYKDADVYSPSLGALALSENRTVVMLARFAGDLLKSKWTVVGPSPDLSEVDPVQIQTRERQRQARFYRFEKYHHHRSRWIAFKRVAEWLQSIGHPPYSGIIASIHAGRFERGGKSQILFMSRAAIVAPFGGAAIVKGCLRFSTEDFREADHAEQDKEVLQNAYLSHFWIPRRLCWEWFREQKYEVPPWLVEAESTAVGQPIPAATESTPKRFSAVEAKRVYSERRAQNPLPSITEDKAWAMAEGYPQRLILGFRGGYVNRKAGQKKSHSQIERPK